MNRTTDQKFIIVLKPDLNGNVTENVAFIKQVVEQSIIIEKGLVGVTKLWMLWGSTTVYEEDQVSLEYKNVNIKSKIIFAD